MPLDAYLTGVVALITVTGVIGISAEQPWRQLLIVAIALYFVASFIVAQATLLSLVCSLVIGSIVGVAVRYIGGSVNLRPDGRRIADAVQARGIHLRRLERDEPDDEDYRAYSATTRSGSHLAVHDLTATNSRSARSCGYTTSSGSSAKSLAGRGSPSRTPRSVARCSPWPGRAARRSDAAPARGCALRAGHNRAGLRPG